MAEYHHFQVNFTYIRFLTLSPERAYANIHIIFREGKNTHGVRQRIVQGNVMKYSILELFLL